MTDVAGNPEEERRADFYYLPWSQEAVCRYFYSKVCLVIKQLLTNYIALITFQLYVFFKRPRHSIYNIGSRTTLLFNLVVYLI